MSNTKRPMWLCCLLFLVGCGRPQVDPLADTQWTLVLLNGHDLVEESHITLNFAAGSINGFAGCNTLRSMVIGSDKSKSAYKATEDGALMYPNIMITEKDCAMPKGVMQQEQTYIQILRSAVTYRIVDDSLELDNAGGQTILVFTRKR